MKQIVLYILEGVWNTDFIDGYQILGVAEDSKALQDELELIVERRAAEYVMGHVWRGANEERGERYYEIMDDTGSWAKFYNTEHYVDISETLIGTISREVDEINLVKDIQEYLRSLYESGGIETWKYEYIDGNDKVAKEILILFGRMEDCNIPYNATMEAAVEEVVKGIVMDDSKLEYLWKKFGNVMIDDNECILEDFLGFAAGTFREEIWYWFDERYSKGVAGLMNGCALCSAQAGDRKPGAVLSECTLTVGDKCCTREARCLAGHERRRQEATCDFVSGMPKEDGLSIGKTVPVDVVKKAAYRIHEAGGCGATDSYSEGYDDAITLALDIITEETGFRISEILEYGEGA